jgi:hypothetical protein
MTPLSSNENWNASNGFLPAQRMLRTMVALPPRRMAIHFSSVPTGMLTSVTAPSVIAFRI